MDGDGAPSMGFGLKCKMHKLVHHQGTQKGLSLAGRRLGGQGWCLVGMSDSQSPASLYTTHEGGGGRGLREGRIYLNDSQAAGGGVVGMTQTP